MQMSISFHLELQSFTALGRQAEFSSDQDPLMSRSTNKTKLSWVFVSTVVIGDVGSNHSAHKEGTSVVLFGKDSGIQHILQTLLQKAPGIIYFVFYMPVSWWNSDPQGCIRWH